MSSAHWSLRLLGGFALTHAGESIPHVDTPRIEALLAYLALHRAAPPSRQHVAFLFWPNSTEAQALNNLRQLLFQLRKAVPAIDELVRANSNTLKWRADAACDLDVDDFGAALERAARAAASNEVDEEVRALQGAVALYRGDLLPSCYDDWIATERDHLREQCITALIRLVELLEARRALPQAIQHAQHLQRLNPLREETCLTLMRLHMLNGDRNAALRTYRGYVEALGRELGVAPSRALREAYARLIAPPSQTARGKESLPPLIGRDVEWRTLASCWQRTVNGSVHMVLILGEAGIGKTRLAEELFVYLTERGLPAARTHAYAAEGRQSYAPITDWLRNDAVRAAMSHLEPLWLTEVARLLPELLTQQLNLPAPSPLTEFWQRQRFFEALARAVLAGEQPLMLMLEDAQWCDTETLEWLHYLIRFDSRPRPLVVITARTEELSQQHALHALANAMRASDQLTDITLQPLNAAETAKIAEHIAGHPLDEAQATRLFHESEGNPLFAVEIMRAGSRIINWRSGRASSQSPISNLQSLPPKVYAVISNRLAQLSPEARALARLAATVGRAFETNVLADAGELSENALAGALDELWQRRIVREAGSTRGGIAFDFSHDKIRDVAYAEISPLQRRLQHGRVARALEHAHLYDLDAVSAQIAAHHEQAGIPSQAAAYYHRAATLALRLYAYDSAIVLLKRGLAQASQIADAKERAGNELRLYLDLAPPIRITQGWASPELELPLQRAWELSQHAGDADQQARAQLSLAYFHLVRAEYAQARQLSEDLLTRLQSQSAGAYKIQTGQWRDVEVEYRRALETYDESQHVEQVALIGANFGVLNIAWSAHALWFRGLADQALERGHEAMALADRLTHPFSQAVAMSYVTMQFVFRREFERTISQANQAYDFAVGHNVGYYREWSDVLKCWASAKLSPGADAVGKLQLALERFRATGGRVRLTLYLSLLAECLGDISDAAAAFAALDEAFDCSERFDERWLDAELYRLRGELLLRHSANVVEAESSLTKALEIAREQGTPPLELRAALSLARLHSQNNARVEAALAQFTEGFDQPDVREARALLGR